MAISIYMPFVKYKGTKAERDNLISYKMLKNIILTSTVFSLSNFKKITSY